MKENGDAVLREAAVASGVCFGELDGRIGRFGHGIGDAVLGVASSPGRWRLSVLAASMIGGRREWVAQKYHRSKNFLAAAA